MIPIKVLALVIAGTLLLIALAFTIMMGKMVVHQFRTGEEVRTKPFMAMLLKAGMCLGLAHFILYFSK